MVTRIVDRAADEFRKLLSSNTGNGKLAVITNLPLSKQVLAFDIEELVCHTIVVKAWNSSDGWLEKARRRKGQMTVQAHLESLHKKHVDLEEKLHSAMTSPSVDDREIAYIKRMKLRIKDQMQRLASSVH